MKNLYSTTKIELPFIDNASHGYIKISKYDLIGLKIFDKFSSFSYYSPNNGCFYLEEDCDALKLFKLLKEKNVMVNVTDGGVDENLTNGKVRLSSRALAMNHGVQ